MEGLDLFKILINKNYFERMIEYILRLIIKGGGKIFFIFILIFGFYLYVSIC